MGHPYENLDSLTLLNLFERSVGLYPDNPLCGFVGGDTITYIEYKQKVDAAVSLLREHGIAEGDKVVILGENSPHWGVAYFAITSIGAVAVPVLVDFHPNEIHHIIRHSEAKAAFISQKFAPTLLECKHSPINFVIALESLKEIKELSNQGYIAQIRQKTKEMTQKLSKNHQYYRPKEDDLAVIIYTSGTTGHSKGVMLTHKNLVTNAMSAFVVIDILPEDVFLSILPLAHTFECTVGLLVPLLHGCSIYYVDKAPTPSVLLKAFEIVKPTMMLSVPLVIEKIYKNRVLSKINDSAITRNLYKLPFFRKQLNKIAGKKLIQTFGGRIRFFGIGGAALPRYVEEFLYEAEFPYVVGYGLTETAPLLAGTPIHAKRKLGSTGPAVYGVELKLRHVNPQSGEGEICAKSPSIMRGYYKDDQKTQEVFEDGWFLTGDLGIIDEDGYLFISGRSKNVIVGPSGENIYPEQIESIINQSPTVLDSLVLERNGRLVALIHLDYELIDKMFHGESRASSEVLKGIESHLEELRTELNTKVSSYSRITKFIEQTDPFIKTPTKKIKRFIYMQKG